VGKDTGNIRGGLFLFCDTLWDAIFTPEDFSRQQRDIAAAVDDFIKGEITSRGDEIETLSNDLSRALMRKAGELGFLGLDLPERYGGMALDKISSAIVSERFGFGAGSFTITELNHTGIGTLPVALFGTEAQKKKYLPGLITGEYIGAFGLTEPEAGSDALNPLTTATPSADGKYYVLNGSKQFITNAGFADVIFTYAKVDGQFFTAFIVEQKWDGVSVDEEEDKMGMHGTSTRAYHFDQVRVPVENVLGEVGKGHLVALNALNMGRYKVGSVCIGSAKRAFLEAVKYAKQRKQFGKSICEFGMIKEKIAGMATRIYAAESMMYRTAGLLQARLEGVEMSSDESGLRTAEALEEYLIECSINKIYGSETEDYVVDEEVQIHGGYGYIRGSHPELAYRNARINRIWEGTNEINRLVIMNTLLRRLGQGAPGELEPQEALVKALEAFKAPDRDGHENLDVQKEMTKIAKKVFLLVLSLARNKYGKDLRGEQEIIRPLSDMIMGIYAMESAVLRGEKILGAQGPGRGQVPLNMAKVVCHEGLQIMRRHAEDALGALEEGEVPERRLRIVREALASPAMDVIGLRKKIAEAMILYGKYSL
jgi:alkylation response protein AidB-like acyl-CoA dehydrogenase